MVVSVVILCASVAALAVAADRFVSGASTIATKVGLSPVVVGAVVVGFGTSVPEAVASALAAWQGNVDVAVGNVLGSNAANMTLVLGSAGVFATIPLTWSHLRREFVLTGLVWTWFAGSVINGYLSRWEGLVGLILAVGAVGYSVRASREEPFPLTSIDANGAGRGQVGTNIIVVGALCAGWLAVLAACAHGLVWSSLDLADRAGLSGGFAGAAMVAVGTSLPEVFTAGASARRGEYGLLAGNVLGSNLFNSGFVGGLAAIVGPGSVGMVLAGPVNVLALAAGCAVAAIAVRGGQIGRGGAVGLIGSFGMFLLVVSQT